MMRFLRGVRPTRPRWGLLGYDRRPSFGSAVDSRGNRGLPGGRRRAFGSAVNLLAQAERLAGLHPDRDLWTREGWEAFLQALLRVLMRAAGHNQQLKTDLQACAIPSGDTMGRVLPGLRLAGGHRMKVGESIVVETFAGTRSVVVPLEGGVYLIGEARTDDPALGATQGAIVAALEDGAVGALSGRPRRHWTDILQSSTRY